eukprot:COSAG03_NODE_13858_length_485_cov_17.603627_1_plen_118_part_10
MTGGAGRGEAWLFTFTNALERDRQTDMQGEREAHTPGACKATAREARPDSRHATVFRWARVNESFVVADPGGSGVGAHSVLLSLCVFVGGGGAPPPPPPFLLFCCGLPSIPRAGCFFG